MQQFVSRGGLRSILSLTTELNVCCLSTPISGSFTPGMTTLHIVQGTGWVSGTPWTGAEISPPARDRSPNVQFVNSRSNNQNIPPPKYMTGVQIRP